MISLRHLIFFVVITIQVGFGQARYDEGLVPYFEESHSNLNSTLHDQFFEEVNTKSAIKVKNGQHDMIKKVNPSNYLNEIKTELEKEYPDNRIVNLVFHGHSVPAGYFKTPIVSTLAAYPALVLKKIKAQYPFAVVNVIVTAIGGENSIKGVERFEENVLNHNPDVIFIDYGLNDRGVEISEAYKAWDKMIRQAKSKNIKIILLTPSPDLSVNYSNPENELKKHSDQIIKLAIDHQVGLVNSYEAFGFLYDRKNELKKYMSIPNHPNEKGHEIIANEILQWF